jgi:hypothetical protein
MGGRAATEELGAGLTPPTSAGDGRIGDLPALIGALADEPRALTERLYDVAAAIAFTDPPPELEGWITERFGSVAAVREQGLVHVTNRITLDAAVFAPLRARRPIDGAAAGDDDEARLRTEIAATEGDPFCHPETGTPANAFGRVRGAHTVSGANAAAAEEHHGVLVFDRHDPLAFDAELVADVLHTGRAWADAARAGAPSAVHYLLIWNCLWRGGGSIVHGHAQLLLGSGGPHGQLARWRRDAGAYRVATGRRLVDDLVAVHRALGLAIDLAGGVVVLAHLTPVKERELIVVATRSDDEREPSFGAAVAGALMTCRDALGVRAFNLALWRPPLGGPVHDHDLPLMVRLVDRGRPFERPSDIGAMELYGSPVVSGDPFELAARLRAALVQG